MTVKEFNTIRHAAYLAAMKIPCVQAAFATNDAVYLYEVWEGNLHKYFALSWETQMNDETLRKAGFNPDAQNLKIRRIMVLDRVAKSATFSMP